MKTLYIDCGMGAAGDMLTAALLELLPDKEQFLSELNSVGIKGVAVTYEPSVKCGITGTHVTVKVNGEEETEEMHHSHELNHHDHNHEHCNEHDHENYHDHHDHDHHHEHSHTHHHSSMEDIDYIIKGLALSEKVKKDIHEVYLLIAEAESKAHGRPVSEIHFHEVGTMDAIADITAVCMLMEKLSVDKVMASPVHVGSGHVHCAHGILPVPAPATAHILKDVPIYGGEINGELCTPTGAALLKYFVNEFANMPVMKVNLIGYGMGKTDFPQANCVRTMLGDTKEEENLVSELSCNLDDMTAEAIAFAMEKLLEAGALDVFTSPVTMKKSRPGTLLTILCKTEDKEKMIKLIFLHTSTIGIRENICKRYTLSRTIETVPTEYGQVRKKVSKGYGIVKEKFEYEDISRIAKEQNMSLSEVTTYVSEHERK